MLTEKNILFVKQRNGLGKIFTWLSFVHMYGLHGRKKWMNEINSVSIFIKLCGSNAVLKSMDREILWGIIAADGTPREHPPLITAYSHELRWTSRKMNMNFSELASTHLTLQMPMTLPHYYFDREMQGLLEAVNRRFTAISFSRTNVTWEIAPDQQW